MKFVIVLQRVNSFLRLRAHWESQDQTKTVLLHMVQYYFRHIRCRGWQSSDMTANLVPTWNYIMRWYSCVIIETAYARWKFRGQLCLSWLLTFKYHPLNGFPSLVRKSLQLFIECLSLLLCMLLFLFSLHPFQPLSFDSRLFLSSRLLQLSQVSDYSLCLFF